MAQNILLSLIVVSVLQFCGLLGLISATNINQPPCTNHLQHRLHFMKALWLLLLGPVCVLTLNPAQGPSHADDGGGVQQQWAQFWGSELAAGEGGMAPRGVSLKAAADLVCSLLL